MTTRTIVVMVGVGLAGLLLAEHLRTGAKERATADGASLSAAAHRQYRCPMHPGYVSDRPGECPICGMTLVPFEAAPATPSATAVADRAVVNLTPERRRLLGVRTEPVRRVSLERTIRTVGRVVPDERRLHHVHTKFEAYVEDLYVDYTGKFVKRGQPLASLYSPELLATQQEYLLAWRAGRLGAARGLPGVALGGAALLEAARQRLLLWDIRPQDIARLEETGQVKRTLDLYSDVSGYVVQKMAVHGMRVTPADALFDVADLSRLWVLADVYEADLPSVRVGMTAELGVPYVPGRTWRGAVTYVALAVEEKTRTIKVRVEVDNQDGELKPEMFADVVLKTGLGEGLVAPESALLRSGPRTLVFVDRGDGTLEPRQVLAGSRTPEGVQVLEGLAEGDQVVTSANFLLDSESSLQAALGAISPPPPVGPVPARPQALPPPAPAAHRH
jgi:Cu(I)/Ag(I) efflux system membrane fusion protein